MVYENFGGWRLRKNKPNSKPNKANFEMLPGAIRLGGLVFSWLRRKELMKDIMDFFRKTDGYGIDLRRKIAYTTELIFS